MLSYLFSMEGLSEEQIQIFKRLKEKVDAENSISISEKFKSDGNILAFLLGKDYNLELAFEQWYASAKWRMTFEIDTILVIFFNEFSHLFRIANCLIMRKSRKITLKVVSEQI
jgi:hypothetical protein